MLDDEYLDAQLEGAIGIMQNAVEEGIENNDKTEMYAEIKRGYKELMIVAKKAEKYIAT